jgi:hypothetical protein
METITFIAVMLVASSLYLVSYVSITNYNATKKINRNS